MGWVKIRSLGMGAFGKVYLAQSLELLASSRRRSEVPVVALKCAKESDVESLQMEEQIYNTLGESRYILKFIRSSWCRDSNGRRQYCLAFEYASGGNLQNHILGVCLSESVVRSYTKQLLKGLKHVHRNGYVHCDLKPDNILVFPSENAQGIRLKLADFGRAKRRCHTSSLRLRGTLEYSSPESVVYGEHEVAADIWSLGCIVYRMLHGHGIWAGIRNAGPQVLENTIAEFQGRNLRFHSCLSASAQHFMRSCLKTNPRKRWKTEQLLQHPFISEHN